MDLTGNLEDKHSKPSTIYWVAISNGFYLWPIQLRWTSEVYLIKDHIFILGNTRSRRVCQFSARFPTWTVVIIWHRSSLIHRVKVQDLHSKSAFGILCWFNQAWSQILTQNVLLRLAEHKTKRACIIRIVSFFSKVQNDDRFLCTRGTVYATKLSNDYFGQKCLH